MNLPEYKYFVFDGASSHYYSTLEEAIVCFAGSICAYPQFSDIITLCKIIDRRSETSVILVSGSDVNSRGK